MQAVIQAILDRYAEHIEFLGDDLTDVNQVGAFGSRVLHLASFAGRVSDMLAMLGAGADINAIGDLGLTPLHYAVLGGDAKAVEALVAHGADGNLENEFGETPAQLAWVLGNQALAAILGSLREYSSDDPETAKQRWLDFQSIQQKNFDPCS